MIAKDLIIYAKGAGHGHVVRAINYAQMVKKQYNRITILCYESSLKYSENLKLGIEFNFKPWKEFCSEKSLEKYDLIVDTFTRGHQLEINIKDLAKFHSCKLLARYNKAEIDPEFIAAYDEILLPYGDEDEWQGQLAGTKIGILIKNNKCKINPITNNLAIVDPYQVIKTHTLKKLENFIQKCGFQLKYYSQFNQEIKGKKVLVMGAGYNTFYELYGQIEDIVFFPFKKKFDDQFHRVKMYNNGIYGLKDILNWIAKDRYE